MKWYHIASHRIASHPITFNFKCCVGADRFHSFSFTFSHPFGIFKLNSIINGGFCASFLIHHLCTTTNVFFETFSYRKFKLKCSPFNVPIETCIFSYKFVVVIVVLLVWHQSKWPTIST